jgi:hypothetical protein
MTELAPLIPVAAVRVLARYFVELTFGDGTKGPSSNYLGGPSAADPSAATLPGPGPRK